MSLKKNLFGLFLLSLVLILAACGGSEDAGSGNDSTNGDAPSEEASGDPIVLKMANITQGHSELSLTLQRMGEKLEERTDGRITAELFPGGQLGNEADMMQQLNTGSIDMAVITNAQLSSSSPAFGAWLMPFVVDTHEQAYELWTSEESMALFDTLTSENVKGLGYATSGFRYFLSTRPIESISDLGGYKLRTTPSPTITDFWNAVNASPTAMPLTEVYTALQTNVIDGVDIDTESLVNENLTEIATYMTPSNHMYWGAGVLINNDLWESLSAEDQALIQEAVDEATLENNQQTIENEKVLLETGEAEFGITIVDLADPSEFDEVVTQIRESWTEKSPEIGEFLKKADEIKAE